MLRRTSAIPGIASMAALALGLAACGGGSSSSGPSMNSAGANTAAGGEAVATKSIAGTGTVLVDSSGMAL
jgi:hypothetical protein